MAEPARAASLGPAAREAASAQLLADWMAAGGSTWLPLRGQSMAPFLPSGSRLHLAPVVPSRIRPGDLLVYRVGERLVCHRVVRRRGRGWAFLVKGDGAGVPAEWIDAAQVVARVVTMERNGRLFDTRSRLRRLQARSAALRGLLVHGWRTLRRWGGRRLRAGWTWAGSS